MKKIISIVFFSVIIISFACSESVSKSHPAADSDSVIRKVNASADTMPDNNCIGVLSQLVRSTDFYKLHSISPNYDFYVDESTVSFVRIKVCQKTDIHDCATLGWIEIDLDSSKVKDISSGDQHPVALSFDNRLMKELKQCKGTDESNAKTEKILPVDMGHFTPDTAYVMNWNGTQLYQNPNGKILRKLYFNNRVQVKDTVTDWIEVSANGTRGFIKEEDLHQVPMYLIDTNEKLSVEDIFRKYFGKVGELEKTTQSYDTKYIFNSKQISIEKGYQLLKLFLDKKERDVLPAYLPEKDTKTKYDEYTLEISKSGDEYKFSYLYGGGETTATLKQDQNHNITIEISYNAD